MGMSDAVEAVTGGESASMYQMRVFEIDNNGRWKIAWLIHDGWKVWTQFMGAEMDTSNTSDDRPINSRDRISKPRYKL